MNLSPVLRSQFGRRLISWWASGEGITFASLIALLCCALLLRYNPVILCLQRCRHCCCLPKAQELDHVGFLSHHTPQTASGHRAPPLCAHSGESRHKALGVSLASITLLTYPEATRVPSLSESLNWCFTPWLGFVSGYIKLFDLPRVLCHSALHCRWICRVDPASLFGFCSPHHRVKPAHASVLKL